MLEAERQREMCAGSGGRGPTRATTALAKTGRVLRLAGRGRGFHRGDIRLGSRILRPSGLSARRPPAERMVPGARIRGRHRSLPDRCDRRCQPAQALSPLRRLGGDEGPARFRSAPASPGGRWRRRLRSSLPRLCSAAPVGPPWARRPSTRLSRPGSCARARRRSPWPITAPASAASCSPRCGSPRLRS